MTLIRHLTSASTNLYITKQEPGDGQITASCNPSSDLTLASTLWLFNAVNPSRYIIEAESASTSQARTANVSGAECLHGTTCVQYTLWAYIFLALFDSSLPVPPYVQTNASLQTQKGMRQHLANF